MKSAIKQGHHSKSKDKETEWQWLPDLPTDIDDLHIKTAAIHGNKLYIFGRGQPKGSEAPGNQLLIFNLIIERDGVKSIDPNYTHIKLSHYSTPEPLGRI